MLTVHSAGGIHTERRLPKRRRGQRNSTAPDIIDAVRLLVRIASDDLIAGLLNRNGLVTGNGNLAWIAVKRFHSATNTCCSVWIFLGFIVNRKKTDFHELISSN